MNIMSNNKESGRMAFLENEFFQFLRHVIVAGIFGFLVATKRAYKTSFFLFH
jgi:hypothetical protein